MGWSKGGIHGKMEYMAQTVQFHQGRTSLMFFKLKIRLVATFTFPPLQCTRLQAVTVASKLAAAP
ncbi:hypothetical protein A2U01_0038237 [Trifolium medium]|uniref:Uncharacterized protein n=1 Tax=Trifolium medium TaxID=97028 RepID=A0A392Q058_9FABA|nr:hypothetical protein [Trifolium medium]